MHYVGHGGACCGISHVFNIGQSPITANSFNDYPGTSRNCLERAIEYHGRNAERVLEVVTAQDVDGDGSGADQTENWENDLVELGFQKVSSFVNSNSGNVCTIWNKHPELTLYGEERQPGRVEQVERFVECEVEVPARVERRPLLVEYCPNFRATGRGRMFSSAEEVRNSHPLVRRIDRRTVFSDGSIVWRPMDADVMTEEKSSVLSDTIRSFDMSEWVVNVDDPYNGGYDRAFQNAEEVVEFLERYTNEGYDIYIRPAVEEYDPSDFIAKVKNGELK